MGETTSKVTATGRQLGAMKSAAKKVGCSVEEWHARRVMGERHCYRCRKWMRTDWFCIDKSRRGSRASICKKCSRKASTACRYGVHRDELARLAEEQEYKCASCHRKNQKLVVDHDHKTGTVRALLCSRCNVGMGLFQDSPRLLRAAISYLEKHNV